MNIKNVTQMIHKCNNWQIDVTEKKYIPLSLNL